MLASDFYRELESILEFQPGSIITGTENLATLGQWDSMAFLTFIAFADDKLGTPVNVDNLTVCNTPADLGRLCMIQIDN